MEEKHNTKQRTQRKRNQQKNIDGGVNSTEVQMESRGQVASAQKFKKITAPAEELKRGKRIKTAEKEESSTKQMRVHV